MNDPQLDSIATAPSLSDEQRATLEQWLCEENLSHRAALRRCKTKFGVLLSNQELCQIHRDSMQQRNLAQIALSTKQANEVVKQFTEKPADMFHAILKIAGQVAFQVAVASSLKKKPDPKPLNETLKILISARKDDREETKLAFEREKWEFDVARACFDHHAELQAISADPLLDEDARLLAIRHRLFGNRLPD